jgi:drug/metabolite transporter (DMT)-like permease
LNLQVRLAKVFPSRYWATTLTCLSGSLQAFVIGILIDHDTSAWRLKWDLQLLTVVYSVRLTVDSGLSFHTNETWNFINALLFISLPKGIFNTGVAFILMSWAVKRRGPIYPSMFNSLAMVATVIMDSALLGTSIFLGR